MIVNDPKVAKAAAEATECAWGHPWGCDCGFIHLANMDDKIEADRKADFIVDNFQYLSRANIAKNILALMQRAREDEKLIHNHLKE